MPATWAKHSVICTKVRAANVCQEEEVHEDTFYDCATFLVDVIPY